MAQSMGQHKGDGHSDGMLGHGGTHRVTSHGSHSSASHTSKVHVQDPGGFTTSNSHGGNLNVGCC